MNICYFLMENTTRGCDIGLITLHLNSTLCTAVRKFDSLKSCRVLNVMIHNQYGLIKLSTNYFLIISAFLLFMEMPLVFI